MSNYCERFQDLLRELFQFDCADLDFGIYRIMNHKRGVIEKFITHDLPKAIADELERGALAEQSQAAKDLKETADQIAETLGEYALGADGELVNFRQTSLGQHYLALREKLASGRGREALEATIFNHLYAFFSRYYQDGDFVSKRRYSKRQKYAIPYNGEEVYLYWANHDQYYVKTAEHFHDYTWKAPNGVTVHFKLTAADVEQNNVKGDKRLFLPRTNETAWDEQTNELVIPFEFRPLTDPEKVAYGTKNQQEKIIAEAVEAIPNRLGTADNALAALIAEHRKTSDGQPVSCLEHHLRQYTRRNTSDFFIHKDLKGFLSRELDFYLKNEVLNLDEMEVAGEDRAEGWFQVLRVIKAVGGRIIDFLDQIESFQKMLWEKRKFVTETQYCITVGNIDEALYPEIAACEAQWEEWKELFHVDEGATNLFTVGKNRKDKRVSFLKEHPTLVLDTRHFEADFVDRLLADIDDMDGKTDGLLFYSENFQALSLLQERFRNMIECVYIDPPYNTDASPIVYKNGYKSSSWTSLMDSRLRATRQLLRDNGVLVAAIDDEQQRELSFVLPGAFDGRLLGTVAVRANPSGRPTQTGYSVAHEYLLFAGQGPSSAIGRMPATESQLARFSEKDEEGAFEWRNLRREGSNSDRAARPALYYPIYIKGASIRVPRMTWDADSEEWVVKEEARSDEQVAWPHNERGEQKTWRWEWKTVTKSLSALAVRKNRAGEDYIYYKRRPHEEGVVTMSCWFDAKYSATEHGTVLLKAMFGKSPFTYPKSIHAVADAVFIAGAAKDDSTVLDYFAGSGTTGHAVINLNRNDGGSRKFILAEMGHYFDTLLLPRIKKATFTPEWKGGKPKRMATAEEAERSPRIVKVIRLESFEDALNNIEFDDASGQQAIKFDDYLLKYMLKWETRKSETLLNIVQLAMPFSYKLTVAKGDETIEKVVDLPETFNYLLGLRVETRRAYDDGGRRYLVYRGRIDHRQVAVIWRETEGWKKADLERDKRFVAKQKLTEGADEVFVNGDSFIPNAKALEPVFKARMFSEVQA